MKRLIARVKCLKCNAVYDARLIKLRRLNLHWRTYERCDRCGKWAWHIDGRDAGPLSQKEESETK
ncbi:hypothetical protein M1O12_05425 [Dehalococcoidia bacterium]|nr:hypothetical protein [Dehalococcoidia bacterium]